jgi:hypothetical protein
MGKQHLFVVTLKRGYCESAFFFASNFKLGCGALTYSGFALLSRAREYYSLTCFIAVEALDLTVRGDCVKRGGFHFLSPYATRCHAVAADEVNGCR